MLIICNDVYYRKNSRKCSLFVNLWFSGSNLNGNVKNQDPYLNWDYVPLSKIHPNLHGVLYQHSNDICRKSLKLFYHMTSRLGVK